MASSEIEIHAISSLIDEIRSGRISRNKNFFTFNEAQKFKQYKRAKLLMSVIEDLKQTANVTGNEIVVKKEESRVEIRLFNPILKYRRLVFISEAELDIIKSQTNLT